MVSDPRYLALSFPNLVISIFSFGSDPEHGTPWKHEQQQISSLGAICKRRIVAD
jgi:hypothetical protein